MNQLVTIPNFSEGELIIDVDKTTYEELKITERQKGFKVYTDIKIPKQQISNDLITFFKESDVDFERFVSKKTITKNIVFAKWELKNKEKNIYRKVDEKKLKTTIKVYILRESVIRYLKFKTKDIKEKEFSYCKKQIQQKNVWIHRKITKHTYERCIEELQKLFDYYTTKVNNSTFEESIDYTAERLLSMDIELKSHIQMREEQKQVE